MPAAPASDPARRNVTEIVRFTSMPIIAEASVSWETARIALPCFVERTNQERPTRSGITMISTDALLHEYAMSPMWIAFVRGMKFGTVR